MFLKKTDDIDAFISKYAESSQKTVYAIITSVLSLDKDRVTMKKTYNHYKEETEKRSQKAREVPTELKTEKQDKNWITWEEVQKRRDELEGLPLLVLSLYTYIAPRRNKDYLEMVVFKALKKDKTEDLPKDKNYLIVDYRGTPQQFIFNVYKTAKTYGTQTIPISDPLKSVIKTYLSSRKLEDPKAKETPFLMDDEGKVLTLDNSITRILNKIFGKKVGSSMLRHIFLSDKYNIKEMKQIADAMGHSLSQQKEYMKESS
jgi:integrase